MKVAFIGQKGIPAKSGGVDIHTENLAYYLTQKGAEVFVYNRKGYLEGDLAGIKEWKGIKLITLPFINTKNLAAITHSFLATIDAVIKKVDVIHYHGIGPSLLIWIPKLLRPKTKVVATLHSFDYGNDKWGSFARLMLKSGEKLMCKYADEVIVLTALMRDYLYQRHGRDSVIIPNGAKAETIEKSKMLEILNNFNLEEKKYLVSVSRLIRLKGIQYVINSFKKLKDKGVLAHDYKLVIVGDGEYENELKKLADNHSDIVFCGNQKGDSLVALYTGAALFIQSSEMEGLSISLLEAMSYGLPILASDISANREAAAETATYFIPKDETDLLLKLEDLLRKEDELETMGDKSKQRVEEFFNWETISIKVLNLYKKVLEKI